LNLILSSLIFRGRAFGTSLDRRQSSDHKTAGLSIAFHGRHIARCVSQFRANRRARSIDRSAPSALIGACEIARFDMPAERHSTIRRDRMPHSYGGRGARKGSPSREEGPGPYRGATEPRCFPPVRPDAENRTPLRRGALMRPFSSILPVVCSSRWPGGIPRSAPPYLRHFRDLSLPPFLKGPRYPLGRVLWLTPVGYLNSRFTRHVNALLKNYVTTSGMHLCVLTCWFLF
jgi:hypothetical protein